MSCMRESQPVSALQSLALQKHPKIYKGNGVASREKSVQNCNNLIPYSLFKVRLSVVKTPYFIEKKVATRELKAIVLNTIR